MLFNGNQHVAEHGRAARTRDSEKIGKPCHLQAKIGNRPIAPFVSQRKSGSAGHIGFEQRTGHCIKPRGINQHIKLIVRPARSKTGCCDPVNGRFMHVDQLDIVTIKRREIVPVQNLPLATQPIILRQQTLCCFGVVDQAPDILTEQFIGDFIGFRVGVDIREIENRLKAALINHRLALFRMHRHD